MNRTIKLLLASSMLVSPAALFADDKPVDQNPPAVAPKVEEKVKEKKKHSLTKAKKHEKAGKDLKAKASTKVDAASDKIQHNQEQQPTEQPKVGE